ncbi:MAG: response regulator, partial [Tepidimonas sp.]|nr:response regulator [Tepidimonas sp.]
GLEALRELRAREARGVRRTPVIMVTAYDLPEDRRRLLEAGADGYVAKPLDAERLLAEMQRVLG